MIVKMAAMPLALYTQWPQTDSIPPFKFDENTKHTTHHVAGS